MNAPLDSVDINMKDVETVGRLVADNRVAVIANRGNTAIIPSAAFSPVAIVPFPLMMPLPPKLCGFSPTVAVGSTKLGSVGLVGSSVGLVGSSVGSGLGCGSSVGSGSSCFVINLKPFSFA